MWFFWRGNKRLQICSDELSSFRFKGVWGFFFSRNRILWFQSSSKDSLTRERVCDVRHSCYRLRVSAHGAFLYCGKQNCADIRLKDERLRSVLFLSVLFRLYEHSSTAEGRIVKFMNSRMKSCASRYVRKNFQCMYVSLSLYVCVCVPSPRCESSFGRNRFYAETDKFYAEKIIFDAHWRFADTSFLLCSKCSSLEILNCSLLLFCSYEIFADTSFLPLSFFEICRMELPSLFINWDLNCWLLFFSAHWRFELLRILLWKLPVERTVDRTDFVMQKCSLESELLR